MRFLSKIEKWKDFSNLAPYPIELDGKIWKSSEHYYQFKKFEKTGPEYAQKIKDAPTPKDAKKLSMENNNYPADWDAKKVEVLRRAVMKKFESYSQLENLLLSTGDEELIEANQEDYFWGEGRDGSGKNMMGKILMETREYLRGKNQE
ncbi:MAG: NADAR family protein [Candidatus Delongbacteria bacterium]|nr:NADAR family protein [Candidatus Delongbacteria bacterium]